MYVHHYKKHSMEKNWQKLHNKNLSGRQIKKQVPPDIAHNTLAGKRSEIISNSVFPGYLFRDHLQILPPILTH